MYAQNPETNSGNWVVTKLANMNQLVSFPNEITVGPDGWLWITERATNTGNDAVTGERVVRVHPDTGAKTEMLNLSNQVFSDSGQDGLMGMAIHPALYANVATTVNNYVYLAYTYNIATTASPVRKLRLARFTYNNATHSLNLASQTTLIENIDASNDHNSGRLIIGPDLKLYYTVGDNGANQFANQCNRILAQALPTQVDVNSQNWSTYKGKLLRLNLDGSIPVDNPVFYPFAPTDANPVPNNADTNRPDSQKVRSHIYSYGHRNAQGIIFDSLGNLFQSEHGDRVDDEVNLITAGKNYGWPLIVGDRDNAGYSYSIAATTAACTGSPTNVNHLENAFPEPIDFVAPIADYNSSSPTNPTGGFLTWPTVAPSGIDIFEPQAGAGMIPWNKSILIPTLKKGAIYRYEVNSTNDGVQGNLIEFHSSIDRYRDIAVSPDGRTIYAVTDSSGSTSGPTGSSSLALQNPGAVIKIEYRIFPEPSNQVTNFTATDNGTTINLNWTDAAGTNLAQGYAIAVSTTPNNFPTYTDGVVPTVDSDLSDGNGLIIVSNGVESYEFSNLEVMTTYYFQITAFSNGDPGLIDFLASPAAPEASATTTISLEPTIIITEVVSRDITQAYVEIFNYGTLPVNLTTEGFKLGIAYNGSNSISNITNITATLQPGQYYTIGRASGGLTPDLTAFSLINGNGNDSYLLLNGDNEVVDVYGVLGQNGTGTAWDYTNARAVRKITVSSASATWIPAQWIIEPITSFSDVTHRAPENISFTYNNNWAPYDPSGSLYQATNATVINGNAAITASTLFNNLTIQSGSSLNIGTRSISLNANLLASGTLNASNGSLRFNGTTATQTINGNGFEVSRLLINNDVNVNVDLAVNNVLQSQSGTLTVNNANYITLKSDATRTAIVDEVLGTLSGNFITERYIPAKRAFRFLTSSVNTAGSINANWQESGANVMGLGTHITGTAGSANGFDTTATGSPSLYSFNNTTQQWVAAANTNSTNLTAGTPYRLLVRGDRTVDLTSNTSTATNTTLRATGNLATGTRTFNGLSSAAGAFNFVGNPYQAPVDLSQVLTASTNLNPNFVYFWDPTVNARGAYVTVDVPNNVSSVSSDFNKYAQPHTAFFTTTLLNGAASITFEETHKNSNEPEINVFSSPAHAVTLNVKLFEATAFAAGARERDGVRINFSSTGNNGIDAFDATKFGNIDENLSVITNGTRLSIENRALVVDDETIQFSINNYRATQYVLRVQMDDIHIPAYLYDAMDQSYTSIPASGYFTYPFTVNPSNALSIADDRFQIKFSTVTLSNNSFNVTQKLRVYPNPTTNHTIYVDGLTAIENVKLFTMIGQEIHISKEMTSFNGQTMTVNLPQSLTRGTYILRIGSGNNQQVQKVIID